MLARLIFVVTLICVAGGCKTLEDALAETEAILSAEPGDIVTRMRSSRSGVYIKKDGVPANLQSVDFSSFRWLGESEIRALAGQPGFYVTFPVRAPATPGSSRQFYQFQDGGRLVIKHARSGPRRTQFNHVRLAAWDVAGGTLYIALTEDQGFRPYGLANNGVSTYLIHFDGEKRGEIFAAIETPDGAGEQMDNVSCIYASVPPGEDCCWIKPYASYGGFMGMQESDCVARARGWRPSPLDTVDLLTGRYDLYKEYVCGQAGVNCP